jgi:hypothetical protein
MLHTGKHRGQTNGRDILPPMPWLNYKEMSDSDLKAVWAYFPKCAYTFKKGNI